MPAATRLGGLMIAMLQTQATVAVSTCLLSRKRIRVVIDADYKRDHGPR